MHAFSQPNFPHFPRAQIDLVNLVQIVVAVKQAGGEIILLKGQVKDSAGLGRGGLCVDIWQCDVNGKYLHDGDSRNVVYDHGFQGFGHDITNANGEYQLRIIKPTLYPGRTPHIQVKVCDGDKELLTTQFYLDNEADNNIDSLFRRMSEDEAAAVTTRLKPGQ